MRNALRAVCVWQYTDGRTYGLTYVSLTFYLSLALRFARERGSMSFSPPAEPQTSHDFLGEFAFAGNVRQEVVRSGTRVPVSQWIRELVFRRDSWRCQICGSHPYAAAERRRSGALHLDHIKPWSAGGSDRTDNLRTLCGRCNMRRSNTTSSRDRSALPIIRACVVCLSAARFGPDDVPNRIDVWCACCQAQSFSFPTVAVL